MKGSEIAETGWRRQRGEPSMLEVFRSITVNPGATPWRRDGEASDPKSGRPGAAAAFRDRSTRHVHCVADKNGRARRPALVDGDRSGGGRHHHRPQYQIAGRPCGWVNISSHCLTAVAGLTGHREKHFERILLAVPMGSCARLRAGDDVLDAARSGQLRTRIDRREACQRPADRFWFAGAGPRFGPPPIFAEWEFRPVRARRSGLATHRQSGCCRQK